MQTDLFEVHRHETNQESQSYLEAGRVQFSKNCKTLYDLFMQGYAFTSLNSPMGDFRRRICDLKENGVHLSFETNGRVKTWYMSETDKQTNKTNIKCDY